MYLQLYRMLCGLEIAKRMDRKDLCIAYMSAYAQLQYELDRYGYAKTKRKLTELDQSTDGYGDLFE